MDWVQIWAFMKVMGMVLPPILIVAFFLMLWLLSLGRRR